jgi:hypothetical protein
MKAKAMTAVATTSYPPCRSQPTLLFFSFVMFFVFLCLDKFIVNSCVIHVGEKVVKYPLSRLFGCKIKRKKSILYVLYTVKNG